MKIIPRRDWYSTHQKHETLTTWEKNLGLKAYMWFFLPAQYLLSALTGLPQCSGVGPQPFLKWNQVLETFASSISSFVPVHDLHILLWTTVMVALKDHLPRWSKILHEQGIIFASNYLLVYVETPGWKFADWTDRRGCGRGLGERIRARRTNPGRRGRSRRCRGCAAAAHGHPSETRCTSCSISSCHACDGRTNSGK